MRTARFVRDAKFYVYEHVRSDTGCVFWVGKGHGQRAWDMRRRNQHYANIVAKLKRNGGLVDIRLVCERLLERGALALEIARIAYWRGQGVLLANMTLGGEGVTGLKHSAKTRKRIGDRTRGVPNPEHSARLRGRKASTKTRAKMSASRMGRVHNKNTRAKIGARHRGRIHTEAARQNMSNAHLGNVPSEGTRAKMTASQLRRWANNSMLRNQFSERWKDPEFAAEMSRKLRFAKRDAEAVRAASAKGTHVRWHVGRNIVDSNCTLCKEN